MTVHKLTHEEADRRLLEAMKPQKKGSEALAKLREAAKKSQAGVIEESAEGQE